MLQSTFTVGFIEISNTDVGWHDRAKPTEPPPPYPPPPPFVAITSKNVEDQIGLLRLYYQERLAMLAPPVPAPPPVLGMPLIPPPPGVVPMDTTGPTLAPMLITLPDDPPPPAQAKLGPIGQVMKSGSSTGAVKKKAKATGPPPKDTSGGLILPLPPGLLTLKPEDMTTEPITTTFGADGLGDGGQRGAKGALSGGNAKQKAVDLPPIIAASA